jgi:imidazoleglycerol-phosphate dehydratase
MKNRTSKIDRKTNETKISLSLNLDGKGVRSISTGIGFFDHMLDLLAKHALFDLNIKAEGDINVDYHHTVEDVGICMGQAFKEALGDKTSIVRFSNVSLPMQESLANVALDISGRSALVFNAKLNSKKIGDFDSELIKEFL